MRVEGEHSDDCCERETHGHSLEHRAGAVLEPHVLQEQHDLEALAVDRGEAEQHQAGGHTCARAGEQLATPPVVVRDPTGPVHAMEEPVHDYEQHAHGDEAGDRLNVEARAAELADHPGGGEPRGHRYRDPDARARGHRTAADLVGPAEAGDDRGKHQDRLEALAQHQQAAVEDHGACAEVRLLCRIRHPALGGERRVEQ